MTAPCTVGGARADKAVPPELPYTTAFESELGKFARVPVAAGSVYANDPPDTNVHADQAGVADVPDNRTWFAVAVPLSTLIVVVAFVHTMPPALPVRAAPVPPWLIGNTPPDNVATVYVPVGNVAFVVPLNVSVAATPPEMVRLPEAGRVNV